MSFRELVDSIAIPDGDEVSFSSFRGWFERRRGGLKGDLRQADAHALFEEFRGVLGAPAQAALTLEEYQALGLRQSLFAAGEARGHVHELFDKYREWLKEDAVSAIASTSKRSCRVAFPVRGSGTSRRIVIRKLIGPSRIGTDLRIHLSQSRYSIFPNAIPLHLAAVDPSNDGTHA